VPGLMRFCPIGGNKKGSVWRGDGYRPHDPIEDTERFDIMIIVGISFRAPFESRERQAGLI